MISRTSIIRASSYEPGNRAGSVYTGMNFVVCSYGKFQPGYRGYRDENIFDKLASLSKLGGQNGIILPCKSIRISFISKVRRVDKAMIVANDTC